MSRAPRRGAPTAIYTSLLGEVRRVEAVGWSAPAQQSAARALLATPLVDDDQGDVLAGVRRHRRELERFFGDELGYRLDASRPGQARLAKVPGPGHEPRGLRTRSGKGFDRRRYALVCLVLASAETAGERTTLARLFSDISARAAGIDDFAFSTEVAGDRRAFVQAVQAVEGLGVLDLAQGDEERFARGEAGADALYRIDRERLALLPTTAAPPSLLASPRDLLAGEVYPDTDDGRVRRRRHRVMRALVEQPVVYTDDLADDEREYLTGQRARIERVLDQIGLQLEVRAEGWVAVDEDGGLTDLRWPDYGTPEVAALRVCDELRARRGRAEPDAWGWEDVVSFVAALADQYAGYWRQGASTPAGAAELATHAVGILTALRLAHRVPAGVVARPAAGRFALRSSPREES